MSTPSAVHRRAFGIGTRTELRLADSPLLLVAVRAGDVLRGEAGTVWITFDGRPDDLLLGAGRAHVMEHDARLRVSGFGAATLEIYGRDALRYWTPPATRRLGVSILQGLQVVVSRLLSGLRPPAAA